MKWFVKALNQYADFKGRAGRKEYWMFILFNFFVTFVIAVIGFGLCMWTGKTGASLLPLIYAMAVWIPGLAVTIRRLHDVGRSAWFLFAGLIPVVGGIWLLVVLILKGVPDENRYGHNPATTAHLRYFRRRSAAVALILSSVIWLLLLIWILFDSSAWDERHLLALLLPVGLIITGATFFLKRMFAASLASSLIVLSVVWMVVDALEIKEVYSHLATNFDMLLLVSQFVVFVPLSFFLSGLYILLKKSDRTVPACFLFAGAIIWILTTVWKLVQIEVPFDNIFALLSMARIGIIVIVPVSLLVFARTLLSQEKPVKEAKIIHIDHIDDKLKIEPIGLTEAGKTIESVVPPETIQKVEPISQPEVSNAVEPKAPPETVQKVEPFDTPETIQKVEPISQPEVSNAVEPVVPPEIVQKVEPIVPPVIVQKVEPIVPPVIVQKVEPSPVRSQPVVSGNRRKVVFVREDMDNSNIWVVYKAPSKVDAMAFLSKVSIDRPSYFVVVETPEGNFGRDKDGFYQE